MLPIDESLCVLKSDELLSESILEIKIPSIFPLQLRAKVQEKIENIKSIRHHKMDSEFDSYEHQVRNLQLLAPLFINKNMAFIWKDLFDRSPEITLDFIEVLFEFKKLNYEAIQFKNKKLKQIQKFRNEMIKSHELFISIADNEGHLNDKAINMLDQLILFETDIRECVKKIKESLRNNRYFNNGFWPITRQVKTKHALAIFFLRKIYHFFCTEYGEPMYGYINEIVTTIFNSEFSENEIIKHCQRMNSCFSENSAL